MSHYDQYGGPAPEFFNKQIDVVKSGKDKAGKAEGARYAFLDLLPEITHTSALDKKFSRQLNDFVYTPNRTVDQVGELVSMIHEMHVVQFKVWEDLTTLRNQAIMSGKYSPLSYKEPIDVEDLLDAVARHWIKHLFISYRDEESGQSHLSHILANLIIIAGQLKNDNQD